MSNIHFIEDHDARVEELRWLPDGRCELSFAHLAVYHRATLKDGESEAYEVWSYQARLTLHGVSRLMCEGELTNDPLMNGDLFGPDGEALRWELLLARRSVGRVHLQFATGASFLVDCEAVELTLGERGPYLERWSGLL